MELDSRKKSRRDRMMRSNSFETQDCHYSLSRMKMQPVVRSISPTNSLIFISKEDELKSGRDSANCKQPKPSTQPLSSMYCEKMDLTLSDINFRYDSQCQLQLGDRFHKNTPEGSPRDSGLFTDPVGGFDSPDSKLTDQSGESYSSPRDEDGRWGLEGTFKNNVDTYLENQPRSASYITEDSSFISEKPVAEGPEENRKLNQPVEKLSECAEIKDGVSSVTPETDRAPDQVEQEKEIDDDVEQHPDVELEEQCGILDAEEPELEDLIEDGVAKSLTQQEEQPELNIAAGVELNNDDFSKVFKKMLDRNKFGVDGETLSLNERQREKKERVKSAPEEKTRQVASYGPPSRPASAIITPKKLLLHHKELVKDSRPGSASSFQMMRTEAWRSSASSVATGFPTAPIAAERFIQFVVDENQPKNPKVKFLLKSKRPPPQRPTSPDHYQANSSSQQSLYKSFSRPANANDNRGYEPLPTSKWLAGGRNLHLEDVNTRQQLSADKLPGYLDGVYISSKFFKKKRYIPRANLGIDSLPSRPIKPTGMSPYTHRRNNASEQFASTPSPQVHRLNSWSRPRFSNLGDIKRLSSPTPLGYPPKT